MTFIIINDTATASKSVGNLLTSTLQVELATECSAGRVRKARCQDIRVEKTVSQKIETAIAQTMSAE
jgi:hypothetical protein